MKNMSSNRVHITLIGPTKLTVQFKRWFGSHRIARSRSMFISNEVNYK